MRRFVSRALFGAAVASLAAVGSAFARDVLPAAHILTPADRVPLKDGMATLRIETAAPSLDVACNGFHLGGGKLEDARDGFNVFLLDDVRLKAGPNVLALTPIYANDRRGESVYETVYAPGRPSRVEISFARKPVADGRTPVNVVVRAFDTWNHAAAGGAEVNVTVVTGNATLATVPDRTASPGSSALPTSALPGSNVSASLSASAIQRSTSTPSTLAPSSLTPSTLTSQVPASVFLQPASIANRRVEGVLGDDGTFAVRLVAGQLPGDIQVTAIAGDATGTQDAFAEPFARQPLVIGLASVGVGSMPGPVNGDDIFDNGGSRRGRVAFYGSGDVGAQTMATVAYETANRLEPSSEFGPYTYDPTERTYLTYGDASQRADDALSRNHLYARVDHGHDSLMYGEFDAQTGSADSVGSFEALLSGPKLRIADNRDRASLTAFTADNDVAYGRLTISPLGLSTIGRLLHPNLIVGSESVNLVSLDRRTGAVISQTPLTRNVDYTLDYYSGLLRFITIPLPYDAYFNPQVIVVQYQYDGQASGARTTGGRVAGALGRDGAIHLGFGYVNDSTGSSNYTLFSEDAGGAVRGGTWSFSHATSGGGFGFNPDGTLGGDGKGDALRASIAGGSSVNHYSAQYESTTAGFGNPFGGLSTPGLVDYALAYTRATGNHGELSLSYDAQHNGVERASYSQSSVGIHLRQPVSTRLNVLAGLDLRNQSGFNGAIPYSPYAPLQGQYGGTYGTQPIAPVPAVQTVNAIGGTTSQAQLGFDWKPTSKLSLAASRLQDFGGVGSLTSPTETDAQASYRLGNSGSVYIRQLWASAPTVSFASASLGLAQSSQATRSTVLGFERDIDQSTSIDSEYVVDRTAAGSDAYAAFGVRQKVAIAKNIKGDAFVQAGNAAGGAASGFTVFGTNLSYANGDRLHATASVQDRTGGFGGATLNFGIAGALSTEFSILGTFNESNFAGFDYSDARFGLAWRPSGNQRGAGLLGFERAGGAIDTTTAGHGDVVSYDQLYRPTGKLELAGRFAYKVDGDSYYAAHTSLYAFRSTQRLGPRLDIGGEWHWLTEPGLAGTEQSSFAAELGYRLGNSFRLAGGYNFDGSADPSLVGTPVRRGLYVSASSVIDRVFGWGAR